MKLIVLLSLFAIKNSFACSAFCTEENNDVIVGKNLDWKTESGFISFNPKGLLKKAFGDNRKLTWKSVHQNITFNQYGLEFPDGGINDAGLTIEVLWLKSSEYPENYTVETLNEVQWIQYNLDMSSSLEDVIRMSDNIPVKPLASKVHYFVCDLNECAVFEYVSKKLVVTKTVPGVNLITNNTYAESLDYLKTLQGFGGNNPIPQGIKSLERFGRLAWNANYNPASPYDWLDSVRNPMTNRWQIVYNLTKKEIRYRTRDYHEVKHLDQSFWNFSCGERKIIPLQSNEVAISSINYKINREYILKAVIASHMPVPIELIDKLAAYPDTLKCED